MLFARILPITSCVGTGLTAWSTATRVTECLHRSLAVLSASPPTRRYLRFPAGWMKYSGFVTSSSNNRIVWPLCRVNGIGPSSNVFVQRRTHAATWCRMPGLRRWLSSQDAIGSLWIAIMHAFQACNGICRRDVYGRGPPAARSVRRVLKAFGDVPERCCDSSRCFLSEAERNCARVSLCDP